MGFNGSKLIALFSGNENRPCSLKELKTIFGIQNKEEINGLLIFLNKLIDEGLINYCNGKYSFFTSFDDRHIGTIKILKSGDGILKDNKNTYTISANNLNGALDGDIVIIIKSTNDRDFLVKKIVERKTNDIVFVCHNGRLVPYKNNKNINISLSSKDMKETNEGDFVLVSIVDELSDGTLKGIVTKKIGNQEDIDIFTNIIAVRNGFELEFSDEVMDEVKKIPISLSDDDLKDRIDLTEKNIFTIDCDDTQDIDDAVSLEYNENGNFVLGIHIADVSHYVPIKSKIFKSAYKRGTSVYLPYKTIHMLPEELSQGVCSLNEKQKRLTISVEMTYDNNGELLNYKIFKSFICSKKKMKYSDINKMFEENIVPLGYESFVHDLFDMKKLSDLFDKAKKRRGFLELGEYEIKVNRDKNNNPVSFPKREIGTANKLIENFMLAANQTIAESIKETDLAFLYRVHDIPDEDRLQMVLDIISSLGYSINKIKSFDNPKALQSIINELSQTDEFPLLSRILLRGIKKAKWSTDNIGHFGLALDDYAQFTSPIRRFPDLVVHHLVKQQLNYEIYYNNLSLSERALQDIAYSSSQREKDADRAEEEAKKLNMAIYMQTHVGEDFNGIITDINEDGIRVKTIDNITGFVSFENVLEDEFLFNKGGYIIQGRNTNMIYRIGDYVTLNLIDACPEMLTIDFAIKSKIIQNEKPKAYCFKP